MDTTTTHETHVAPVSLGLHKELTEASKKQTRKDARSLKMTGYGATTGGMMLTRTYLDTLTTAIITKLSEREHILSEESGLQFVLKRLKPDVIALALIQQALHDIGRALPLVETYERVGWALQRELWAKNLLDTDRKLLLKVNRLARERRSRVDSRHSLAVQMAADSGYKTKGWSREYLIRAGNWGVNMLCSALPDVFIRVDAPNGEKLLTVTDAALERAFDAEAHAILQSPVYQPRLVRPADWTTYSMKIAEDPRVNIGVSLLRTYHKDLASAASHAIKTGTMEPALTGLNALQSVPWKINGWLLSIIQRCWDLNLDVPGMPMKNKLAEPEKLSSAEFAKLTADERTLRRNEIKKIKQINVGATADAMQLAEDMRTAGALYDHERFYTPMNCDWRGRVYGLCHFNFQREDRVRALFEFADGEAIGEEGLWWLKVHVANCGDFDKISKRRLRRQPFAREAQRDDVCLLVQTVRDVPAAS
jgi:DNA-directed RNA polymerase